MPITGTACLKVIMTSMWLSIVRQVLLGGALMNATLLVAARVVFAAVGRAPGIRARTAPSAQGADVRAAGVVLVLATLEDRTGRQ